MTPTELAKELGIDPKRLRAWLRATYPRSSTDHGDPWQLGVDVVSQAQRHFGERADGFADGRHERGRDSSRQSPTRRRRSESDESYVLDLVDEALAEVGKRQHRFGWLRGDPGANGQRVALPVDAWYPDTNTVVEYRELQHDEPSPFFDRRETVSGVDRGQQRRIYDRRRDELIPSRGIRLVVIRPSDLNSTSQGRLRRQDRAADLAAIEAILRKGGGHP